MALLDARARRLDLSQLLRLVCRPRARTCTTKCRRLCESSRKSNPPASKHWNQSRWPARRIQRKRFLSSGSFSPFVRSDGRRSRHLSTPGPQAQPPSTPGAGSSRMSLIAMQDVMKRLYQRNSDLQKEIKTLV